MQTWQPQPQQFQQQNSQFNYLPQQNSQYAPKPFCQPKCNPATLEVKISKANNRPYHYCPNCKNSGASVSHSAGVTPPIQQQQQQQQQQPYQVNGVSLAPQPPPQQQQPFQYSTVIAAAPPTQQQQQPQPNYQFFEQSANEVLRYLKMINENQEALLFILSHPNPPPSTPSNDQKQQ